MSTIRSFGRSVAVVVAIALTGSLAACSPGGGEPTTSPDGGGSAAPPAEATTINVWARQGGTMETLVKNFNTSQSEVQVALTQLPDDQFVNKVGTGVRSSNGPDVLDFDTANGSLFGAMGVLADLTDKLDDLGVSDWASAGQVESGQYNGATYSLPNITGPSFLLYNKDLYAKAGLPDRAPSTWAEIRSDAEAIRALGDDVYGYDIPGACGGCLAFTFQPLIWASDGTTMTAPGPDQTTTYSTSPQAARAFEFYRDMWADGLVAPSAQTEAGATWGQDFLAGKVGIMLAGAWIYTGAQADGLDIGIGPIPGETGGYSTFAGGNNLGITSSSEKADAAWTFLKWVYEDSQQMEIIKTGEAPARQVAFTDEIVAENPLLAITQQVGDRSVAPASIAYNSLQLAASSPWLAAFQSIVFQGGDTASTLQKADEDSRQLIVQAYEQTVQ